MKRVLLACGAAALVQSGVGTALASEPNLPPVAVVTPEFVKGSMLLKVCVDASKSHDPEGGPITFRWDFGDGRGAATTAKACHEYVQPGLYAATVTVTDRAGETDAATVVISVEVNKPRAPGA